MRNDLFNALQKKLMILRFGRIQFKRLVLVKASFSSFIIEETYILPYIVHKGTLWKPFSKVSIVWIINLSLHCKFLL